MPAPRGLVQWLDQVLHREPLWAPRSRLLVAVSGGADSVALLRLLLALNGSNYWRCTLIVGHVDHGLRGRASRGDAAFVAKLAKSLDLPCIIRKLKLPKDASEDDARQVRLQALAAMVKQRRCAGVVMAHHADDQAETVLMKLFRGCGLNGLAGMSAKRDLDGITIFRPLLFLRGEALRLYLNDLRQPWREDDTNSSSHFTRNRLRGEILPRIEAIWPVAVDAICRMSRIAGESRDFISHFADEVFSREAVLRGQQVRFSRKALQQHPVLTVELLRRAIARLNGTPEIADAERLREVLRLLAQSAGGKRVDMGKGIVVCIGKTVIIERQRRSSR